MNPQNRKVESYSTMDNKQIGSFRIRARMAGTADFFIEPYFITGYVDNPSITFNTGCYGGEVDLVSGTLKTTWAGATIKNRSWTYEGAYSRFSAPISDIKIVNEIRATRIVASCYQSIHDKRSIDNVPNNSIYGTIGTSILIKTTDCSTVEDFLSMYGSQYFVYPLNSPIIAQFSPQTITIPRGDYIICSPDGEVEVKYWSNNHIDSILPPEYKRVQYVRAANWAYVDTGYTPTYGDEIEMEYEIDALQESGGAMRTLFSAGDGTRQLILLGYNTSCMHYFYKYFASGGAQTYQAAQQINKKYSLKINLYGQAISDGVIKVSPYEGELDGDKTDLWIFRRRHDEAPFYGKLYSFIIRNNGIIKLHMVPCIRLSDNIAGAYDLVSGTFHRGTPNIRLVAGPDYYN